MCADRASAIDAFARQKTSTHYPTQKPEKSACFHLGSGKGDAAFPLSTNRLSCISSCIDTSVCCCGTSKLEGFHISILLFDYDIIIPCLYKANWQQCAAHTPYELHGYCHSVLMFASWIWLPQRHTSCLSSVTADCSEVSLASRCSSVFTFCLFCRYRKTPQPIANTTPSPFCTKHDLAW